MRSLLHIAPIHHIRNATVAKHCGNLGQNELLGVCSSKHLVCEVRSSRKSNDKLRAIVGFRPSRLNERPRRGLLFGHARNDLSPQALKFSSIGRRLRFGGRRRSIDCDRFALRRRRCMLLRNNRNRGRACLRHRLLMNRGGNSRRLRSRRRGRRRLPRTIPGQVSRTRRRNGRAHRSSVFCFRFCRRRRGAGNRLLSRGASGNRRRKFVSSRRRFSRNGGHSKIALGQTSLEHIHALGKRFKRHVAFGAHQTRKSDFENQAGIWRVAHLERRVVEHSKHASKPVGRFEFLSLIIKTG